MNLAYFLKNQSLAKTLGKTLGSDRDVKHVPLPLINKFCYGKGSLQTVDTSKHCDSDGYLRGRFYTSYLENFP